MPFFSRQERAVVLSFVGVLLVGSAVLLAKRANPNFAQDLLVSGKPAAAKSPGQGEGRETSAGRETTALEAHIREVEGALAGESPKAPGDTRYVGRKIDLNTVTETELMLLPGIGPARARAIIGYRVRGGVFKNLEDVQKVEGIGPGVAARIEPWICYE